MHKVFLGFGSNLGDREKQIEEAMRALAPEVKIVKSSSLYESEPVGNKNQPWFLNSVAEAQTELGPQELLIHIKKVEANMGRDIQDAESSTKPRPIDIDMLFYDHEVINEANLKIPHPRLHLRRFVLIPLNEIAPDLAKTLLKECPDTSIVRALNT